MAERLEPGLYVGTRLASGIVEAGTTLVKVSGEPPWLKLEELRPHSTIPLDHVKNLVRIDPPIVRNEP